MKPSTLANRVGGILPHRRARPFLALAATLAWTNWQVAQAQSAVSDESLKAAFTLNFARFTEWPAERLADQGSKLQLCVTGERSDGGQAYADLAGKSVQGRTVDVRWVGRGRSDVVGCWVLVVTERDRAVGEWLRAVKSQPILTVGDAEQFVYSGGMLGLVPVENRLRFDANLEAARAANLRLSSQLLNLARTVKGGPGTRP
jgi:hypothetical protein